MKFYLILFAVTAIYSSGCESLVIDCNYDNSSLYFCSVQNNPVTTSKDSRDITGVRGTHQSGQTNDDVTKFIIHDKTTNFFPRGITKYFKNIDYVHINYANLKEITKEDLKEFGDKLKELDLDINEIEVIEADLFIYNKNLEGIYMSDNKIKHIENGAFDHLKNLIVLYLGDNPCTLSGTFDAYNRSNVIKLIQNVEEKCNDRNIRFIVTEITTTMKTLQEENLKNFQKLSNELSSLKGEISNLNSKISTLDSKMVENSEKIKSDLKILQKENEKNFENLKIFFESEILKQKNKYEENFSTLDLKFSTLNSKLDQLKSEFVTLTSNLVEKGENHKNILVSEYAKQTMKNEQNLEKMALEIGEKIEGSCKREEPTSEN
jgi:Leucine-rich repeat (LRR) protein